MLALEHLTIPPNVNFDNPNPKVGCPVGFVNAAYDMYTVVPWKEAKLTVPTEP